MNLADRNFTSANWTTEQYLENILGAKHLPYNILIPITIVYIVIFITGLIGNIIVCIVISQYSNMQTATNYYLCSLAVSDLAFLIMGIPNDLKFYWQQYPWLFGRTICKLRAFVSEMTSYSSVLVIAAFSAERYLATCHPLISYTMSGLRRALKIIFAIWTVSCIFSLPFAIFTEVNYVDRPLGSQNFIPESSYCAMLDENKPANLPLYELSAFLFFIVPVIIITVFYVRIALTVRLGMSSLKGDSGYKGHESKMSSSKIAIIRMLVAVVITFFICWAPFHAQRLMYVYGKNCSNFRYINEILFIVTGVFYYISATINPILYNLMSAKYRDGFCKVLRIEQLRHQSRTASFSFPSVQTNHKRKHVVLYKSWKPIETKEMNSYKSRGECYSKNDRSFKSNRAASASGKLLSYHENSV